MRTRVRVQERECVFESERVRKREKWRERVTDRVSEKRVRVRISESG